MKYRSFRDIIVALGGVQPVAVEMKQKPAAVEKWKQRDSIPAAQWIRLVKVCQKKSLPVSVVDLAYFAEEKGS